MWRMGSAVEKRKWVREMESGGEGEMEREAARVGEAEREPGRFPELIKCLEEHELPASILVPLDKSADCSLWFSLQWLSGMQRSPLGEWGCNTFRTVKKGMSPLSFCIKWSCLYLPREAFVLIRLAAE